MYEQNAHTLDDIEVDSDTVTKYQRRLENAITHAWTRWSREYVKTLMDYHRITRTEAVVPEIGGVVLIVGEEENCGLWMEGKMLQHFTGRDGVIRGAVVLHMRNHLERPLQLLCPLEIRSEMPAETSVVRRKEEFHSRGSRVAARNAEIKTKLILDDV